MFRCEKHNYSINLNPFKLMKNKMAHGMGWSPKTKRQEEAQQGKVEFSKI